MSSVSERPLRPAPILTEDNAGFWDAAREHRLAIQRCRACDAVLHPPRPMCPQCHSTELSFVEASGHGSVYSFAILHHPQHPAFEYPLLVALVELDEGARLVTNLVDVEVGDVHIGMPVEVAFVDTADDGAVPVFRPRAER